MLWRLSSGRPGLPACIPAVHTYGRGLDCADGLMRTAEPTCEPPNQPCCAKVQCKPAPGRPSCRPGWPCSPLAFCPPPSPGPSGQMARGQEGRRSALRFSIGRKNDDLRFEQLSLPNGAAQETDFRPLHPKSGGISRPFGTQSTLNHPPFLGGGTGSGLFPKHRLCRGASRNP